MKILFLTVSSMRTSIIICGKKGKSLSKRLAFDVTRKRIKNAFTPLGLDNNKNIHVSVIFG
jgi:hypothetical protein